MSTATAAAAAAARKSLIHFPFPFQVGTDICHIPRVLRILANPNRGPRFVERLLVPEERETSRARAVLQGLEQAYVGLAAGGSRDLLLERGDFARVRAENKELWRAAEFLAGRFAAKEAAIKAHPLRSITFHSILIKTIRRTLGRGTYAAAPPEFITMQAIITGRDADQSAMLSISHDGEYATAMCLGYCPEATTGFYPRALSMHSDDAENMEEEWLDESVLRREAVKKAAVRGEGVPGWMWKDGKKGHGPKGEVLDELDELDGRDEDWEWKEEKMKEYMKESEYAEESHDWAWLRDKRGPRP